ncbi:MAG: glycosyl hydrolase family protein [Alphaproteobacteria bacterium]|jgi:endo-1,3-1,4-beta-glycanase ExoK|nr:MAG: glycosyl hydrolase family protein [Alphaproteobacteria bacterium]
MKEKLERLRELTRAGLHRAGTFATHTRAGLKAAWAKAPETSRNARQWASKTALLAANAARNGWISHRDSWIQTFSTAGIKPLPAGMGGNLVAIGIVAGLMTTSLIYGDYYARSIADARLIPSGEHPSQQQDLPEPETTEPVPEEVTPETPEAAPAPSAGPALPQLGEAFVDRFDGEELDERWFVSDGWSNGDWMDNDWRASQIALGEHGLTMTMEQGPEDSEKPLASAEMRTKQPIRYGYFEVNMRVPKGSGLVTGVFSYAGQDKEIRPHEIDIEILGRNTRVLEATIHENGKPTHTKIRLPFDAADGFHTYGFDWQPNLVRWYADGKLIHEERGGAASRLSRPQEFIIHFWASSQLSAWVGKLNKGNAPWELHIACTAYAPAYSGQQLCK